MVGSICARDFVSDGAKDELNRKMAELIKVDGKSDENSMTVTNTGEKVQQTGLLSLSSPTTTSTTTSDKIIKKTSSDYKMQIRWLNVFIFIYLHVAAVYGCYLLYFKTKWVTFWLSKLWKKIFFVSFFH